MVLVTTDFRQLENPPDVPEEVVQQMVKNEGFLCVVFSDEGYARNLVDETTQALIDAQVKFWVFYPGTVSL